MELSESRRNILRAIKDAGTASITRVAATLGITHEAARKQFAELQRAGWISTDCVTEEPTETGAGRPAAQYCLTRAGENLFPKQYASLSARLLDLVGAQLHAVLAAITDDVLSRLRRHNVSSLRDKMSAVRHVYAEDDAYTSVDQRGDDFVLIEKNCPFIDVAAARPVICSTTVSALRRFTGHEVIRERRFQDGDGRCEFRVRAARRARNTRFEIEPPRSS